MSTPAAHTELRETYAPLLEVRPPQGVRPIDAALAHSNRYGRLPVWTIDLPNPDDDPARRGRKRFVVASYSEFKQYHNWFAYEILLENMPTKLYVDVDMEYAHNPALDPAAVQALLETLIAAILQLATEIRAAADGAAASSPIAYTVLDSSKPSKLSKHIVFEFFLKNNYHCGTFMRRVRDRMLREHETELGSGDKERDHPMYIWAQAADPTQPKSGVMMRVRQFIADLKVYTLNRNFRTYGSRKVRPGAMALYEEGAPQFNWDTYDRCMLQRKMRDDEPVFACLEEDGSEPVSTSNANVGRYDIDADAVGAGASTAAKTRRKTTRTAKAAAAIPRATHLTEHWGKVFPFELLYDVLAPASPLPPWAAQGAGGNTWRREFQFVRPGDRWTPARYFESAATMRLAVLTELPEVIHVGPVRSVQCDGSSSSSSSSSSPDAAAATTAGGGGGGAEPWQPTLVFDVDMNDYAKFRPCCGSRGAACEKCWPIASFAQRAITEFVRETGLGQPLCFFSGNKGVHVWCVGERARVSRVAGSAARKRLLEDFDSVVLGRTEASASAPSVVATARRTQSSAEDLDVAIHAADIDARDRYAIPNVKAKTHRRFVQAALGSAEYREELVRFICNTLNLKGKFLSHVRDFGQDSAILHVLWPALDRDVVVSPSHKIKAPFCVHPTTGRVCIWLRTPDTNPYVALGKQQAQDVVIDPAENAAELASYAPVLRARE